MGPREGALFRIVMQTTEITAAAAQAQLCRDENVLFEDSSFPASTTSLGDPKLSKAVKTWRRPRELLQEAGAQSLFGNPDVAQRQVLQQGEVEDCWLIGAMATLMSVNKVQGLFACGGQYADIGMFLVRFYKRGVE